MPTSPRSVRPASFRINITLPPSWCPFVRRFPRKTASLLPTLPMLSSVRLCCVLGDATVLVLLVGPRGQFLLHGLRRSRELLQLPHNLSSCPSLHCLTSHVSLGLCLCVLWNKLCCTPWHHIWCASNNFVCV